MRGTGIIFLMALKRTLNILRYIFFFLGPGMLYHFIRKRRSWRRLEEYAEKNRIERVRGSSFDDFGEMVWKRDGRLVVVRIRYENPGSGPGISVALRTGEEMLRLKTYRPMNRPTEGWEAFISPNPDFNLLYRTREVRTDYSRELLSGPELFDAMAGFHRDWLLYLSSDIGSNGLDADGKWVTCHLGPPVIRSMFPYITPEEIEAILPDLLGIADIFDSALQAGKGED